MIEAWRILPLSLPSVPMRQRTAEWFPKYENVSCVYFLISTDSRILYVGETNSLADRFYRQCEIYKPYDAACYYDKQTRIHFQEWPLPPSAPELFESIVERQDFEIECIRRFKPPLNKRDHYDQTREQRINSLARKMWKAELRKKRYRDAADASFRMRLAEAAKLRALRLSHGLPIGPYWDPETQTYQPGSDGTFNWVDYKATPLDPLTYQQRRKHGVLRPTEELTP